MKHVLLLEDNQYKRDQITKCLDDKYGPEYTLVSYFALNIAAHDIMTNGKAYDVIILDNIVPRFIDTNDIMVENAAEEILRGMELRKIEVPVIVCSSEEVKMKDRKHPNLLGSVRYNKPGWFREFVNLLV